eukprot:1161556-Pelagomonas_calceolata.AAC.15
MHTSGMHISVVPISGMHTSVMHISVVPISGMHSSGMHISVVGDLLRSLPDAPETAARVLGGVFELGASRSSLRINAAGGCECNSCCAALLLCYVSWLQAGYGWCRLTHAFKGTACGAGIKVQSVRIGEAASVKSVSVGEAVKVKNASIDEDVKARSGSIGEAVNAKND